MSEREREEREISPFLPPPPLAVTGARPIRHGSPARRSAPPLATSPPLLSRRFPPPRRARSAQLVGSARRVRRRLRAAGWDSRLVRRPLRSRLAGAGAAGGSRVMARSRHPSPRIRDFSARGLGGWARFRCSSCRSDWFGWRRGAGGFRRRRRRRGR